MSADKPFILRGGTDEQTLLFNRINAIDRIEYLSGGINLRNKSAVFLKMLDLELWKRWYKDLPPRKEIDEEFCQRAAEVVKAMEAENMVFSEDEYNRAQKEFHNSEGKNG